MWAGNLNLQRSFEGFGSSSIETKPPLSRIRYASGEVSGGTIPRRMVGWLVGSGVGVGVGAEVGGGVGFGKLM